VNNIIMIYSIKNPASFCFSEFIEFNKG